MSLLLVFLKNTFYLINKIHHYYICFHSNFGIVNIFFKNHDLNFFIDKKEAKYYSYIEVIRQKRFY